MPWMRFPPGRAGRTLLRKFLKSAREDARMMRHTWLAVLTAAGAAMPYAVSAQHLDETQGLGRQADVMREVISNGTPRMPGFKHHFERGEIDAIVAYLRTVPAPQAAAAA